MLNPATAGFFGEMLGVGRLIPHATIISPKKQRYRTDTRVGAMGVPYEARIPLEGTYGQLPADYKETELKEGAAAEAFRPGAGLPGQQFNPNQDLPASAEQSMDTTPMATANALYQQGREAARTQAERNQVRDLGLAIHKAHNPHLYSNFQTPMASDRTFNPLMARTFPETYAQTPEAFVASGGVQMPSSMSNADDRNAVIEGNRLEGEQRMMQEMAELKKQEFMREMLARQTGRK